MSRLVSITFDKVFADGTTLAGITVPSRIARLDPNRAQALLTEMLAQESRGDVIRAVAGSDFHVQNPRLVRG